MIKILLTDDHVIVRDGIKLLLKNETDIVVKAEVGNGVEALDVLSTSEIDVVLLDINMPIKDGLETCECITKLHPNVHVIALTMYREMHMMEKMFRKGAKAYLLKSCSKEELIKAIKEVSEGKEYLSKDIQEEFKMHLASPLKKSGPNVPSVSRREKEVLQLISEEMTTAEIASQLFISVATVETHRKNLLRKLGLRNTAGLMRYAFEHSLLD